MHASAPTTRLGRWLIGLCLLWATGLAAASAAEAPVRIMVAGLAKQIYLPAVLAERLGYFQAQGVTVQLLDESSGVHAEDQLLAGAVHGVIGFYDHTIELQAKGKLVQSVVQLAQAPGEALVVASRLADRVRSPADLRHRAVGVTGLGSSTHLLSQYLAAAHGLKAGELRYLAVGSGDSFVQAMRDGRIDAGTTTEPTVSRLLSSGEARLLVDLRTPQATAPVLGGLYPGACLYVTTRWAETHRAQLQRVVHALVMALRYIATHEAEDIAAQLPPAHWRGDRALYVAALRQVRPMFTPDGAMPPAGPETVLKVLQRVSRAVQGRTIDLQRTYTSAYTSAVP